MDGAVVASRGGGKEGEERVASQLKVASKKGIMLECGAVGQVGWVRFIPSVRIASVPVHIASSSFLIGSAFLPTE